MTLKKMIGIISAIAIPATFVGIITHKACDEIKAETPDSETEIETEDENGSFLQTGKSTDRVTTEHKWWTRDGNDDLKLHSVKIGTVGTINREDLNEFKRLCDDSNIAEMAVNDVITMLLDQGYRIVSVYTYDSK